MSTSYLVNALRETIASESDSESDIIYFPWYDAHARDLAKIAAQLHVPLLTASSRIADPAACAGLLAIIEALRPQPPESDALPASLQKTADALANWPSTEALLSAARKRIIAEKTQDLRAFMIFCPRTFSDSERWQADAIELLRDLKIRRIIVSGATRPKGQIRDVRILWHSFSDDFAALVNHLFPAKPAQPTEAPQIQQSPISIKKRALFQDFRDFLQRIVSFSDGPSWDDEHAPAPKLPAAQSKRARWFALVARLCFPNIVLAREILEKWPTLEAASPAADSHRSAIETETLHDRARFLMLLRLLWNDVYIAALNDLDGADQLYRLHLALFGGIRHDSLLSGLLLPRWRASLEDPALRDFFFDCFAGSNGFRPLVQRFESRTQLSKHLLWHDKLSNCENSLSQGASLTDTPNAATSSPDALRSNFLAWIQRIQTALGGAADVKFNLQVELAIQETLHCQLHDFRSSVFIPIRNCRGLHSGEALEFAQMLMTAFELLSDHPRYKTQSDEIFAHISHLLDWSLQSSQGALRFEATLLRARMLVVRGLPLEARETLRPLRRLGQDPLGRAAIRLEEAFVLERSGDFLRAVRLYQNILEAAEAIGADELSARAVLGQLRCDLISGTIHSTLIVNDPEVQAGRRLRLRAQAMVQIQSARAPELFAMSALGSARLFISYRAVCRSLTEQIAAYVKQVSPDLDGWYDQYLREWQDFSPVIHEKLLNSDAMLLILSEEYFTSEWCLHELSFAVGQHDLQGVLLYWFWCEPSPGNTKDPLPWTQVLETWKDSEAVNLKYTAHQRHYLFERLKRLTQDGICLNQTVVRYASEASGTRTCATAVDTATLEQLMQPIRQSVPYLLERRSATNATTSRAIA